MIKLITPKAVKAVGPYSPATVYNDLVFTSGQVALDNNGNPLSDDITIQTKKVLGNLRIVLEEAGSSVKHILKTTIYLTDMSDYATVNEIYEEFLQGHKPARSTVAVKELPKGVKIEIDAVGVKKSKNS